VNADEFTVDSYLRSLDLGDVVHEPDGKIPPDFSVGSRIAIEVRRLNQHYEAEGRARGLEQDTIPMREGLEKLLNTFGPNTLQRSWFVMFGLRRPALPWKQLRPLVRVALEDFLKNPIDEPYRIPVCAGFDITLLSGSPNNGQTLLIGGFTDFDEGGWVVSEVVRNARRYMDEKAAKISPYRARYPAWWLVLVDYIGLARDPAEVRRYIERSVVWDRVILLSPKGDRAFEI
jgi:hypothetical protein